MEPLKLPNSLISRVDVDRLQRELGGLNDFFAAAKARGSGESIQLPKLTRIMDQLARDNDVNLLDKAGRDRLESGLEQVEKHAPRLNISFAAEPSPKAFEQILVWLRQNIHPQALVQIGLQPAIAAGCVLRTPNRMFDMSLRSALARQEPYLTQLIKGAVDGR